MKNKSVLFFLLFFACVTLFFYILNKQLEEDYNQRKSETVEIERNFIRMNEELNKTLAHTAVQNTILEDTLAKEFILSDLVSRSPALIFRYSEINCSSCYKTELLSLHNYFFKEERKIAILSSYREKNKFIMFKKTNRIELPFYRIPQDAFDWILEDYGLPYYFVLHPGLKVSHIYIPDKMLPELNRQYLESVKAFLSD